MSLVTFPRQFLVDINGTPRVGAKANFYQSGTTTPIITYTTASYSTANSNPIISNASGLFGPVYVNPAVNATFKLVITDSADVTLYTEDSIPASGLAASDIGSVFYPRTAAEQAAGVTPSSYIYPAGDVRRYGAVGNNSTDDSSAFQAAVDSNQVVIVPEPPVAYLLNSQINCPPGRPMSIIGSGYGWTPGGSPGGGCLIRLGAAAGSGAAVFNWADFVQGVNISGLSFWLSATGQNHRGLRFQEALQVRIDGNRFEGASSALDDCTAIEFLNPTLGGGTYNGAIDIINNYFTNTQRGITLGENCTTVRISFNDFHGNNPSSASLIGIYISANCVGVKVIGNMFQGWVTAIDDNGAQDTISFNYFEANGTSYALQDATLPICIGNNIVSGGAPAPPDAVTDALIDIRPRNFRVNDSVGEFGLGLREHYRSANIGDSATYTATYSGSGSQTFTSVTATTLKYSLRGMTMSIAFMLDGTAGGTPASELRFTLPSGYKAATRQRNAIQVFNNAAYAASVCEVQVNDTFVRVYKDLSISGSWTAGTVGMYGTIDIDVALV